MPRVSLLQRDCFKTVVGFFEPSSVILLPAAAVTDTSLFTAASAAETGDIRVKNNTADRIIDKVFFHYISASFWVYDCKTQILI